MHFFKKNFFFNSFEKGLKKILIEITFNKIFIFFISENFYIGSYYSNVLGLKTLNFVECGKRVASLKKSVIF